MSKGKSAKGEIVDFDLLKIKQQIASAPPSSDVARRQDFIENRLRRRTKKVVLPVAPIETNASVPEVAEEVKEDIVIEKASIENTKSNKTSTKQKARTTKQTK